MINSISSTTTNLHSKKSNFDDNLAFYEINFLEDISDFNLESNADSNVMMKLNDMLDLDNNLDLYQYNCSSQDLDIAATPIGFAEDLINSDVINNDVINNDVNSENIIFTNAELESLVSNDFEDCIDNISVLYDTKDHVSQDVNIDVIDNSNVNLTVDSLNVSNDSRRIFNYEQINDSSDNNNLFNVNNTAFKISSSEVVIDNIDANTIINNHDHNNLTNKDLDSFADLEKLTMDNKESASAQDLEKMHKQIGNQLLLMLNSNKQQAFIALDPPTLGHLDIKILTENNKVFLQIISDNKETYNNLIDNQDILSDLLEDSGLDLANSDINYQAKQDYYSEYQLNSIASEMSDEVDKSDNKKIANNLLDIYL